MLCERDEIMLSKTGVETAHLGKRQEKNSQRATTKLKIVDYLGINLINSV